MIPKYKKFRARRTLARKTRSETNRRWAATGCADPLKIACWRIDKYDGLENFEPMAEELAAQDED